MRSRLRHHRASDLGRARGRARRRWQTRAFSGADCGYQESGRQSARFGEWRPIVRARSSSRTIAVPSGQAAWTDAPRRAAGPGRLSAQRNRGSRLSPRPPRSSITLRRSDPSRILFLARPQAGSRALGIAGFLEAIGAPPAVSFELTDFPLERKAAEHIYGWSGMPVYDLANAVYAVGIGADFLGTWASPVYYALSAVSARTAGHARESGARRVAIVDHGTERGSMAADSARRRVAVCIRAGELAAQ